MERRKLGKKKRQMGKRRRQEYIRASPRGSLHGSSSQITKFRKQNKKSGSNRLAKPLFPLSKTTLLALH
jgi:hypothetical protein